MEQALYAWWKRFGVFEPVNVKRLQALETVNAKLGRMVAEAELTIDSRKEINRR